MRTPLYAAALLCAVPLVSARDKPAEDAKRLQGTWAWDPAEKQSEATPRIDVEKVVFDGDRMTIHYVSGDRRVASACKFTLDPSASPPAIDFAPVGGANAGRVYLGRYEFLKDGRLRVYYRGPGSTRPKDFDDKQEKGATAGTRFLYLKLTPGA
jgi:uncharacterized protein (TIGR03067 family)